MYVSVTLRGESARRYGHYGYTIYIYERTDFGHLGTDRSDETVGVCISVIGERIMIIRRRSNVERMSDTLREVIM